MLRVLLTALIFACFLSPGYAVEQNEPTLKLMSFNIRYHNPADGSNAWPYRMELVESTIRFHEADVIGMQEVLNDQLVDLSNMLPEYSFVGKPRDSSRAGEHAAIFYRRNRLHLLDEGTFWLSQTPDVPSRGWDAALNRVATWAKFEDLQTGKKFFLYNTHFDHAGSLARQKSAELLLRRIHLNNPQSLPVLVTGDFNARPKDEPYHILTDQTQDFHLIDAREVSLALPHGPEATWSGFKVAGKPGKRIDYIFFQHAVSVLRYATLAESWSGRFSSDHLPVFAELILDPLLVLPNAHAHNDYEHPHPLQDALAQGFNSVEADIWIWGQQLVVTHDRPRGQDRLPRLDELYLAPLARRVEEYRGRVYPNYPEPFQLMIDCKTWGPDTYRALRASLAPYRWMLDGDYPPVQIILSGARDVEEVLKDPDRFVGIDGRPEHLGQDLDPHAMPLISQRYGKVLAWRGIGDITLDERASLKKMVDQAHAEGKRVRLWASPENPKVWKVLRDAGVDYINTDDLVELREFLMNE